MRKNAIILLSISLLLISSCAIEKSSVTGWDVNNSENGGFEESNKEKMADRKMIYNGSISLNVKNTDSTQRKIYELIESKEGFIVKSSTNSTIFRVYNDYLYPTIGELEQLGKVKYKSISGKDVTDEHYDLNIRLENAQMARDRYLELLNRAQTVDETLKVEKELERLNTELDLLQGKIERLDHLVDYATIEVNYEKGKKPGVIGYVFVGVFKAVKWLFVRG